MPTNFKQFSKQLNDFGETLLPQQFTIFIRKIALDLLTRIVEKTAVDTGTARGNWQVGIDTIPTSVLDTTDKGGGPTVAAGSRVIAGITPDFQVVYIANSLPYIFALEDGHSKRSPDGMVAASIAEVAMQFQNG